MPSTPHHQWRNSPLRLCAELDARESRAPAQPTPNGQCHLNQSVAASFQNPRSLLGKCSWPSGRPRLGRSPLYLHTPHKRGESLGIHRTSVSHTRALREPGMISGSIASGAIGEIYPHHIGCPTAPAWRKRGHTKLRHPIGTASIGQTCSSETPRPGPVQGALKASPSGWGWSPPLHAPMHTSAQQGGPTSHGDWHGTYPKSRRLCILLERR